MKSQITLAVLASVSLVLAALLATPSVTSPVFAGDYDDDDDDNGHDNGDHDDDDNGQGHGHKKCEAGNSGNEWPGNGPHKCPPGLSNRD
jgi:hypothetical protein